MQESGNAKIEKFLFYLMLFFSCLAYTGYYVYARTNNISLLISYSRSSQTMMQTSSLFILSFRFGKDLFAALLLCVEMLSLNKSIRAKIFSAVAIIATYGTIIALLNNQTMGTILSGYRMLVFFCALAMYFNSRNFSRLSLKTFLKLLTALLLLNTVVAGVQVYDLLGFKIAKLGQGSYRFMGLFPTAAAYAYFCLGSTLFAYCIETQTNMYHKNCLLIYGIAFVGCYISGTRSAMINLLIILFIYVIDRTNVKRAQKIFVSIILAIPVIMYVFQFSTRMANRGSIFEDAIDGGRFSIFINSILGQPVLKLLFGNGIGAGSNTVAEIMRVTESDQLLFLDGTFTTIAYQFGIVSLIVCIGMIWSIVKKIYNRNGLLNAAIFAGTIVLQCLTTNVLEAFALLIILFVSYYSLIQGDHYFHELCMEHEDL